MNPNIWPLMLALYKTLGRAGAKRALTPPRSFVEHTCRVTGADLATALKERDEAVEETLEFLESLVDVDFKDLDD